MSYINRNLEGKKCFVITPLGENDSETRKKAESIIGNIIEPVVKDKLKLDMILPHRISASGDINNQIIEHLLSDDLVIANLSELNPNVMYELGIRHSAKKHTITLAEIETQLPFDVKTARTIFYSNEPHKFSETKIQLEEAIIENMDLPEKDINNPVYSFYDGKVLKDFIGDNASDVAGVIKEIHKNVDYLIESTDFKNFTYKHAYKGVVYQAGLELSFKCRFIKAGKDQLSVEDKFEFERILEDRINIWNQIGGYGYGESKFEEGYLEYVIHSDKPLNSTHINSEFERIDTKYKIISIDFVEPVYNKYRGMSGSSSH